MRNKLKQFLLLFVVILFVFLINIIAGFIVFVLLCIFYVCNRNVKNKIQKVNTDSIDFMNDKRRNFDALIIGNSESHSLDAFKDMRYLCFIRHGQTLFASYLYLIHYYSYLREDGLGTVFILGSHPCTESEMHATVFDIASFHRVIKMRLKASSPLITKLPLIFLWKKFDGRSFFVDDKHLSMEDRIKVFCAERNLKVIFIEK